MGATVALAACQSDPNSLAAQAGSGSRAGYAAGDGSIEQLAPASRGSALAIAGVTVDGGRWSMTDQGSGKVVVVNVWGSWCPPCVAETPALQGAWAAYEKAGKPVAFVGIDTMESPDTGLAFLKAKGVTYPSISDQASQGAPTLALQGKAPATPTTLVLDRQGRVAARVLGPITEVTLRTLVDAVLAEA
ncbi:MAG TPA: TlpA disulfide reductase family protein [Dermatophilaceae bacterium]|nr:TlpA disulfide reductase family protein [Dermatophilaceae bacterium]